MKTLLAAMALLLCFSPASAQAGLSLTWRPTSLQVDWSAPEAVCVWIVGGGLPDARVGGACVPGGQLLLPYTGVDRAYTPLGRGAIELRGVNGLIARLSLTPPSRVWVPLVVRGEGAPRFEVRLVLVVK